MFMCNTMSLLLTLCSHALCNGIYRKFWHLVAEQATLQFTPTRYRVVFRDFCGAIHLLVGFCYCLTVHARCVFVRFGLK